MAVYFMGDKLSLHPAIRVIRDQNFYISFEDDNFLGSRDDTLFSYRIDGVGSELALSYPPINARPNPDGSKPVFELFIASDGSTWWKRNSELNIDNPTFEDAVNNGHLSTKNWVVEEDISQPIIEILDEILIKFRGVIFEINFEIFDDSEIKEIKVVVVDENENALSLNPILKNYDAFTNLSEYSTIIDTSNMEPGVNYKILISAEDLFGNLQSVETEFLLMPPSEDVCRELNDGQNSFSGERINIIFVGFNFESNDPFIDFIKEHTNHLFEHEPYKSNQDKFNFWYIDLTPRVEVGLIPSWANPNNGFEMESQIFDLASFCVYDNKQIIGIGNWGFTPNAYNNGGRIYIPTNVPLSHYSIVFPHEFSHSFANLHDEYHNHLDFRSLYDGTYAYDTNCGVDKSYQNPCHNWCESVIDFEPIKSIDCSGLSPEICSSTDWCSYRYEDGSCLNLISLCSGIEDESTCIAQKSQYPDSLLGSYACKWLGFEDNMFNSKCIINPLILDRSMNIGEGCMSDLGCYPTCTYGEGFRSAPDSIMSAYSQLPYNTFNYLHQKLICEKIIERTGSAGGICSQFG